MSGQVQKERTKSASSEATQSECKQGEKSKEARAHAEAMDNLLDEIDEVLETNAEAFVKQYVQKGGE